MPAQVDDLPILEVKTPKYEPGRATVLSIWPFEQKLVTAHAGIVTYSHPKCEPGRVKILQMNPMRLSPSPSTGVSPSDMWMAKYTEKELPSGQPGYVRIDVVDTYTTIRDWQAEGDQPESPIAWRQALIPAQAVAEMLVQHFSGGRVGDDIYGGAGIKVYDSRMGLAEQLAELDRSQRELAGSLYDKAEEYAINRQFSNITNVHRTLAQWAQLPHRDWMRIDRNARKEMKECVNCEQVIPAKALICPKCNTNLYTFAVEFGIGWDDPVVAGVRAMKERLPSKVEAKK